MSRKLALSSALSVMMMAGFALFNSHSARAPLAGMEVASPVKAASDALPAIGSLLVPAR